jgi:hypothetical protein
MTPQDVANCAYAFAIMAFDSQTPSDASFRGAHEALLNTIQRAERRILSPTSASAMTEDGEYFINPMVPDFSYASPALTEVKGKVVQLTPEEQELEQLRIFAHYLMVMRRVADVDNIPRSFLKGNVEEESKSSMLLGWPLISSPPLPTSGDNEGSNLQNRVLVGLRAGLPHQYKIIPEASSFQGLYPVDVAVYNQQDMLVAIVEVDGPHHYRHDGVLRRKDRFKEALYRRNHPDSTFLRIRWDEANRVGTDIIGSDLAALIISSAKDINPISSSIRSVQRTVEEFFCWGLRNSNEGLR